MISCHLSTINWQAVLPDWPWWSFSTRNSRRYVTLSSSASLYKSQSITEGMKRLSEDNEQMKESILDIQTHCKWDNLVFLGLQSVLKRTLKRQLKPFFNNNSNYQVHSIGQKRHDGQHPRPTVTKFEHFKQKEMVTSTPSKKELTTASTNSSRKKSWSRSCFPPGKNKWPRDHLH